MMKGRHKAKPAAVFPATHLSAYQALNLVVIHHVSVISMDCPCNTYTSLKFSLLLSTPGYSLKIL